MAPERLTQYRFKKAISKTADYWSIGVIAY
jgi:hypothetical protein